LVRLTKFLENLLFLGRCHKNPKTIKKWEEQTGKKWPKCFVQIKGKTRGQVDRWFPSTKMCCKCGTLHDMPLEKRWMRCDCGNDMSRDENAAMNIKNAGMSALGLDTISGALPPCVV